MITILLNLIDFSYNITSNKKASLAEELDTQEEKKREKEKEKEEKEDEMKYLSGPIRPYYEKEILSLLNEGLLLLDSKRPSNPLEFLGNFFIEKSKNK